MDKYDCLKLNNQLCFPLYAAAKEVVRKYKPFLDKLDLTYTQYIAMMVIAFVATYFLDVSAMVVIIVCLCIGLIDLAVTMGKKGRLER